MEGGVMNRSGARTLRSLILVQLSGGASHDIGTALNGSEVCFKQVSLEIRGLSHVCVCVVCACCLFVSLAFAMLSLALMI